MTGRARVAIVRTKRNGAISPPDRSPAVSLEFPRIPSCRATDGVWKYLPGDLTAFYRLIVEPKRRQTNMVRAPTTREARARKYKKKDKSERRNAKGWMEGKRQDVFLPLVPSFAEAADKGWQALEDHLKALQNMYHFHFPFPMGDADEPAELQPYDATRPPRVDDSALTDEELVAKREHVALYNNVSLLNF